MLSVVTYLNAEVVAGLTFETKAFSVVPTGLELTILLPQPLEYWDYKCVSSSPNYLMTFEDRVSPCTSVLNSYPSVSAQAGLELTTFCLSTGCSCRQVPPGFTL